MKKSICLAALINITACVLMGCGTAKTVSGDAPDEKETAETSHEMITVQGIEYDKDAVITTFLSEESDKGHANDKVEYVRSVRDILTDEERFFFVSYGKEVPEAENPDYVYGEAGYEVYDITLGFVAASFQPGPLTNRFNDPGGICYAGIGHEWYIRNPGGTLTGCYSQETTTLEEVRASAQAYLRKLYPDLPEEISLTGLREMFDQMNVRIKSEEGTPDTFVFPED